MTIDWTLVFLFALCAAIGFWIRDIVNELGGNWAGLKVRLVKASKIEWYNARVDELGKVEYKYGLLKATESIRSMTPFCVGDRTSHYNPNTKCSTYQEFTGVISEAFAAEPEKQKEPSYLIKWDEAPPTDWYSRPYYRLKHTQLVRLIKFPKLDA